MNKRMRIPVFVRCVSSCRLIDIFTVGNDDSVVVICCCFSGVSSLLFSRQLICLIEQF